MAWCSMFASTARITGPDDTLGKDIDFYSCDACGYGNVVLATNIHAI